MNNGEGTRENASEFASPDVFGSFPPKSDGGDVSPTSLSQYSSCGESEFERYLSANSVMGTPSVRSFHSASLNDYLDSEFGSSKSLGFVDDVNFGNFSLDGDGKVSILGDHKIEFCKQRNDDEDVKIDSGFSGLQLYGDGYKGRNIDEDMAVDSCGMVSGDDFALECTVKNVITEGSCGNVGGGERNVNGVGDTAHIGQGSSLQVDNKDKGNCQDGLNLQFSLAFDRREMELEEDGTSSRYEHSEGEDSMYNYGSDEENNNNSYYPRNVEYVQEAKHEKENPLLINSHVAFGSEDWDDFEQEVAGSNMSPLMLDKFQEIREVNVESDRILFYSVTPIAIPSDSQKEQKDDEIDVPGVSREVQDADDSEENVNQTVVNPWSCYHVTLKSLEEEKDIPAVSYHVQGTDVSAENSESAFSALSNFPRFSGLKEGVSSVARNQVQRTENTVVNEMEEILLDYNESTGARFSQGNQIFKSQVSLPLRDGGSTASTSGTDDAYPLTALLQKIDGVEVVGAKQKKGDVSLGERLVGVKAYTVYKIRVFSGRDQWEVERRYRDFFTLYRRLKSFYADQGWILPSPWSSVEKESRKIFGNASPVVVAERSVLIQECLQSVINSSFFPSPPGALIWFFLPQASLVSFPFSNTLVSQSTSFTRGLDAQNVSPLGKTISLIVAIQPQKSMKQMLEAQHFTCAGCHKHFDDGMTLIQDFVQTFGWGKPRLCEYTGQFFCSTCHTSDTAVLPARVLHHWDFTRYPVSQLAKSYLDSVYDQPMLCVSAVNPFLYSKVPSLQLVMGVRQKIAAMLPFVRCPFRRSINKGLCSRRYLLESNDFFALRDLIDLSKGPFAALPVMVENVSRKILVHITEQCLICCDVGVPCSARQACSDPSSLIFSFQEDDIEKCISCEAVFHKPCFRKLTDCPCGAILGMNEAANSTKRVSSNAVDEINGALTTLGKKQASGLSVGLLSGLFSRSKPEKREHKDCDNVILMGSLPSTM